MGNCVGSKGGKKDPKLLTEEEIKLLLDNTRLTRAQIVALHANFLKECPSGKLTKKDFVKLFKEVHPSENKKEKADKFCEYVFKVIDNQNLGYISFQDFVLCFSLTSDGDFKQKCEFAFKLYDLDKDGKISKKEMTQVLTALYDLSGIEDRKKDNAPAKKVEDIIKKINATYQPPPAPVQPEPAPAEPAPAPVDDSKNKKADKKSKEKDAKKEAAKKEKEAKAAKEKKEKPAKPAKVPEYITKEQFIDACTSDEVLKKLFVDSIFSNQSEPVSVETRLNELANSLNVELPSVNVTTSSLTKKAPILIAPENTVTVSSNGPVLDQVGPASVITTIKVENLDQVQVTTSTKLQPETIEEHVEEESQHAISNQDNQVHSDHSDETHFSEHSEYVNTTYTPQANTLSLELSPSGVKVQEHQPQGQLLQ